MIELGPTAPLVSVIIPTYNRAGLVRQALASVKAQTFQDFEIVVVDDGGTHGTHEVLSATRDTSGVAAPIPTAGGGCGPEPGGGRGPGGSEAGLSGDSDHLWLPDKLARQMAFLEGRPELRICQTDETWVRRGSG